jgi:hypothetical protein
LDELLEKNSKDSYEYFGFIYLFFKKIITTVIENNDSLTSENKKVIIE